MQKATLPEHSFQPWLQHLRTCSVSHAKVDDIAVVAAVVAAAADAVAEAAGGSEHIGPYGTAAPVLGVAGVVVVVVDSAQDDDTARRTASKWARVVVQPACENPDDPVLQR